MNPRIVVLVCTHDRPEFLPRLLEGLRQEWQPGVFLAIVDNGTRSSKAIVDEFKDVLDLSYMKVEEPGLVVARNTCMRLALERSPDVLVFIDDDETPQRGWLQSLIDRMIETNADIVTGPVEAQFLAPPPAWATKGDFFNHNGHSFRTSNLAIRVTALPKDPENWFQTRFNRLGGEDSEFLERLVAAGALHRVAPFAVVTEFIPEERLRRRYIWRCGTRDGAIIAETLFARHGVNLRAYAACSAEALRKLGYALNHMICSIISPWRMNAAIRDINAVSGIALAIAGARLTFYGTQGKRVDDIAGN